MSDGVRVLSFLFNVCIVYCVSVDVAKEKRKWKKNKIGNLANSFHFRQILNSVGIDFEQQISQVHEPK